MPFAVPEPILLQVAGFVADYIEQRRQAFAAAAQPLSAAMRRPLQGFFPEDVLAGTRFAVAEQPVPNPPFYAQARMFGFSNLPDFSQMAAITFVDVVVARASELDDRLRFHELVHAVQYQKLGTPRFAELYVRGFLRGGYAAIPLEQNAFELDARFAAAPAEVFSVSDEVDAWRAADRF
jgi:hypothetical protein